MTYNVCTYAQTSLYFKPSPIPILNPGFRYLNRKSIKDFQHKEWQGVPALSFLVLLQMKNNFSEAVGAAAKVSEEAGWQYSDELTR